MMHATKTAAISNRCSAGLVRFRFGGGVCMPFPLMVRWRCSPARGLWRRLCRRCAPINIAELCRLANELHGQRRGGLSALAAVFDDHRVDDLRIIGGCEADEPGIGQPFGFVMLVTVLFDVVKHTVALIIVDRRDAVGGAGLAARRDAPAQ